MATVGLAAPASAETVSVQTANVGLTQTTFSQTGVTASCPGGSLLVGGGARLTGSTGTDVTNDGSKLNGTLPSDGAGNPSTDGSTSPASWAALGGYAGQASSPDTMTSFAMCSGAVAATTEVIVDATASGSLGPVTAVCPGGTSLVGGGGYTLPAAQSGLNDKVVGSYPSDAAGDVPASGATNLTGWTAVGNSNTATGVTTTAMAVCAQGATVPVEAISASNTFTTPTAGAPIAATATCPVGTTLLDGGVNLATGGPPGTGGQGTHLIGDYPSDSTGASVTTGSPASWTATGEGGGQAVLAGSTAVALCDTASPPAATPEVARPALLVVVAVAIPAVVIVSRRRRRTV